MKHVFFLHSHITWLVARGVVRHQGLHPDDVLFACARGYRPPEPGYGVVFFPERTWTRAWHMVRPFGQCPDLARFLDSIAEGGDLVWYLPHTNFPFFKAVVRHPRCRGFHLIEEGVAAYHTSTGLQNAMRHALTLKRGWKGWIFRWWTRVRPPAPADPRYLAAWSCSDEAFPGYERRRQVRIFGDRPPAGTYDVRAVLVFDNVLEVGLAGEQAFFKCVDDLVAAAAAHGHVDMYYKLHPGQYLDSRNVPRIRHLFSERPHGVRLTELGSDCCLELIAASGTADFYLFTSSTGLYAAVAGCRVYSAAERLAAMDERYAAFLRLLPEAVRRRFVML